MKRISTIASCFVLLAVLAQSASADVISDFWQGVLDAGISPGSKIRVVFVTSPVIDALGTTQSYYNDFGDARAATGAVTASLGLSSAGWNPLVTTVEATDSVQQWVNAYDIPVFNTRGELVADNAKAMLLQDSYAGVLNTGIRYDESGDDQAPPKPNSQLGSVGVWTGTNQSGLGDAFGPVSTRLGSTDLVAGVAYATFGNGGATNGWLKSGVTQQTTVDLVMSNIDPIERSIYVMSGEVSVVPEPTALAMWLGFGSIAGLVFWRKRRRSS